MTNDPLRVLTLKANSVFVRTLNATVMAVKSRAVSLKIGPEWVSSSAILRAAVILLAAEIDGAHGTYVVDEILGTILPTDQFSKLVSAKQKAPEMKVSGNTEKRKAKKKPVKK